MKELIIISIGMIICFLFLALSCEKQNIPIIGEAPGIIYNKAYGSIRIYSIPVARIEGGGIGRPLDEPPTFLEPPSETCTYNSALHDIYARSCSQCHCDYNVPRDNLSNCLAYYNSIFMSLTWADCKSAGPLCTTIISREIPGRLPYISTGGY